VDRFVNILFSPLGDDDNRDAIARVADLAHRNGARLTLLGVVPEPTLLHRLLHRAEVDAVIESADRHQMQERLERWCDSTDGVDVDIDVQAGNVALTILGEVLTEGHDLVVVTTDEDRQDRASIKRLLRKCPCPVWVIRPSRAPVQRILVAVDLEPAEADQNATLLELAAGIYDRYGGELHVVHAWEMFGEGRMRDPVFPSISRHRVDELLEDERGGRSRVLDELLADSVVADRPWQIHLLKGPAGVVVPAFVAKHEVDLIVMGTVARTGLKGAVMGNTAEHVLDRVDCSVIATKPPDFVSPLALHT
jgi:universal stress protein E